uniref:Cytotoxic T-lymphocyte protein 4 n=1 Tax=Leptobrachium leishanense TaxID=445787 RepID=A0A8C5MLH5_9ANUR
MLMILFFAGVFCSCVSLSTGLKVTQPGIVVASRHGKATLLCGYKMQGKMTEMRFSLFKKTINDTIEVCAFSFTTAFEPATMSQAIQCEGIPGPNNVTLLMSGLQPEDTGMYICQLEVMYPPPYRSKEGNPTFIYVSDLASECAQTSEPPEPVLYHWALPVICAAILLYSVLVTCIMLFSKQRKRRWDTGFYDKVLRSDSVQHKNYSPYYIRID